MTEVAIIFAVNVLTSLVKNYIKPRWGNLGIQVVVFVMALIAALYYTYGSSFAPLQEIVAGTIVVFSMAVALYEVLLKRIGFFKGN